MAVRNNIGNAGSLTPLHARVALTPLRRKSIITPRPRNSLMCENDDEAERLARRQVIGTPTLNKSVGPHDGRRSLGLGALSNVPVNRMSEKIAECIKMNAENKINAKNAFSLEIIDFMAYMIQKKDTNMSNLQVATTSLDVSTKIYGFRVDGVHMEILRMMGVLGDQEKGKQNSESVDGTGVMNMGEDDQSNEHTLKLIKKKKKRSKQRILVTPESLRMNVTCSKPSSVIIDETDSQTSDTLFLANLKIHSNSGFYLHAYNDIIVDTVDQEANPTGTTECSISRIQDFSEMEICPTFHTFNFHDWSVENDMDEMDDNSKNDQYQFDLNENLQPDIESGLSSINYFDLEDDERIEGNMDRCAQLPKPVENIVDFRDILSNTVLTKPPEYSFIQTRLNIHWAGPSHWKINNFEKPSNNSRVVATCRQALGRKKKEPDLFYDNFTVNEVLQKFIPSKSTKLQGKTVKSEWEEEKLTLPVDMHYNISQASQCYLHPTSIAKKEDCESIADNSDSMDNYDYNNENDMLIHCAESNTADCQGNEQNFPTECRFEDDPIAFTQTAFTGDNLVAAPKITSKPMLSYCTRAKRVDMRQLKKCIWGGLACPAEKENRNTQTMDQQLADKINENRMFSQIYKMLPTKLSKSNAEALSFPLSFVSLLHLANEKVLSVKATSDMSDLIVKSD